jgi:hypothetical protein
VSFKHGQARLLDDLAPNQYYDFQLPTAAKRRWLAYWHRTLPMDANTLSAYAAVASAIGQIASVVAVVISILYLARQLQQSTKALKVATYQADVANTISILSTLYTSPEMADLQLRAHTDAASLSPVESLRWDNYMLCALRNFDSIYYRYRNGTLDRELWLGYQAAFVARLRNDAWRKWFEANRSYFSPALHDLVTELLPGKPAALAAIEAPPLSFPEKVET